MTANPRDLGFRVSKLRVVQKDQMRSLHLRTVPSANRVTPPCLPSLTTLSLLPGESQRRDLKQKKSKLKWLPLKHIKIVILSYFVQIRIIYLTQLWQTHLKSKLNWTKLHPATMFFLCPLWVKLILNQHQGINILFTVRRHCLLTFAIRC